MIKFVLHIKRDGDITKSIQSKDEQMGSMSSYGLLVTTLLISVQDFAFRGRPVSLLVASAPVGSHLFRFSRRSLRLALQSTARSKYIHETYVHHHPKKIRTSWILNQTRSDCPSTNILLFQPLF